MYKIDSVGSVNGHFNDGDYSAGRKGTKVPARYLNTVQSEMCNLVEFLGQTLSKDDDDQILQGMNSFMNGYFTRSYIDRFVDNVDDTGADVGDSFVVPYKGIVDVTASMHLFDVVGGGNVQIAVYDQSSTFVNRALIPVQADEEFSMSCRLIVKNDDPNGESRTFKIGVSCSSGCRASGRITFNGSVISKGINYAQD